MIESYFTVALLITEIIFSIMVLAAFKRAGGSSGLLTLVGVIFALWLAGVYTMLSSGFFTATGIPQISFALALATPVILGVIAQKFWQPLTTVISNMTTANFLALQQMRVVFGVMFFFTTSLPVWFQTLGGLGDISAGIGAIIALRYLHKHPDREKQAIIKGNLVGILDFVVVLNLGLFVILRNESPDIMFDLIPLYAVPIFILLHIFSLQRLWK